MFNIPILVIVYKRKDTLIQVLDRISMVQPEIIYIASDFPQEGNMADIKKNEEVKTLINQYPFTCKVLTNYQQSNLGCGKGPKVAIDWFFEHEERGIILEDDCLPDLTFFSFCKTMLERYESEDQIMSISGNNYMLDNIHLPASYYFTKYPNTWGWATWRRAWHKMDWEMKGYIDFLKKNTLSKYVNTQTEFWYWKKTFDDVYSHESIIGCWDYQWLYSIWNHNGFGIAPNINLVRNIGFDTEATHTSIQPGWYCEVIHGSINEIVHPEKIEINQPADDFQFKYIINPIPKESRLNQIRRKLGSLKNRIIPKKLIWKDNEYFDPIWKERISKMSEYLTQDDKIVDLGCGMMWLKEFLNKKNEYIPVDYKKRDDQTIVCDFNKSEFPNIKADVYFVSGCLEYVENYRWFVHQISRFTERCVISYCTSDKFNDQNIRINLMWKNHLSEDEVIGLFKENGFSLKETSITDLNNHIFYFTK